MLRQCIKAPTSGQDFYRHGTAWKYSAQRSMSLGQQQAPMVLQRYGITRAGCHPRIDGLSKLRPRPMGLGIGGAFDEAPDVLPDTTLDAGLDRVIKISLRNAMVGVGTAI